MNHHQIVQQHSECSPETSPPLSRVHQWQPSSQGNIVTSSHDGEEPAENIQHLKQIPQIEKNEPTADYTDANIRQESFPVEMASAADFSTTASHQAGSNPDDLNRRSSSLPDPNWDSIPLSELPVLKLQLNPPIQIPIIPKSSEEDEKTVYPIDLSSGRLPEIYFNDFSIIGENGTTKEDQNEPVSFKELINLDRSFKPENDEPEISKRHKLDKPYKTIVSLYETPLEDYIHQLSEPKSTQITHDVTVVQPLEEIQLYQPLTLLQTTSDVRSPLPLRETARPVELVLNPIAVPQIILQRGPTITRQTCGPLTTQRYESAYYKASVSLPPEGVTELQVSPPPYSECMKQTPLAICKLQKKSDFLPRRPEMPPPLSRDIENLNKICTEIKSLGIGYSKFPRSGDRTLHSDTAPFSQNRSDSQLNDGGPAVLENDHQLLAFISCLFCWPIGLVAIYYSNMSQMLKSEGNYVQAQVYARQAFIISTLALCSGSVSYIIMFIYQRLL